MNYMFQLFPVPKITHRFTCYIPKGDLTEDILPDEEDNSCLNAEYVKEIPNNLVLAEETVVEKNLPLLKNAKHEELEKTLAEESKEDEHQLIAKGYLPRDGHNRTIYSNIIGLAPKSFITFDFKHRANSPPPTYLSYTELYQCMQVTKEDLFRGFEIPPTGGLLCVDKNIINRQSGVIASMLGQLITTMCISRVSLPVRIFESKSTLERIADLWRYAPVYLSEAGKTNDKVERFKQVITFAIAGLHCSMQQLKPFNPLVGETLEASMKDGTQIFIEHTSHHPPISNFIVEGPNEMYKLYGHYEYRMKISPNSLVGEQYGPNTIEFKDGGRISFRYPSYELKGLIFGNRLVYQTGNMIIEDEQNNLKAVIIFDYGKKRGFFSSRKKGSKLDEFEGLIYCVKKITTKEKKIGSIKDLNDVLKPIAQLNGSWLKNLNIAGTTYWDIDQTQPLPLKFKENPLDTDWRYREDLIWLRRNNTELAQEWKVRLEVEQRRDRATREKYSKNNKKK